MQKTPHTSCKRGKKVRIKLRNGEVVVGKFIEKTHRGVYIEDIGFISVGDIKSFAIYKPGNL